MPRTTLSILKELIQSKGMSTLIAGLLSAILGVSGITAKGVYTAVSVLIDIRGDVKDAKRIAVETSDRTDKLEHRVDFVALESHDASITAARVAKKIDGP